MLVLGEGVQERGHEHIPGDPAQGIEMQVLRRCSPALVRREVDVIQSPPPSCLKFGS